MVPKPYQSDQWRNAIKIMEKKELQTGLRKQLTSVWIQFANTNLALGCRYLDRNLKNQKRLLKEHTVNEKLL
jgi:hypothetical protein